MYNYFQNQKIKEQEEKKINDKKLEERLKKQRDSNITNITYITYLYH